MIDKCAPALIWGAGAIGGTIGAHWVDSGYPVLFVDRDQDHVDAMCNGGLHITGPIRALTVPVRAVTPDQLTGRYSQVLLCVKAQDTDSAADALREHLTSDGYVVSVQNGLNEHVLAHAIGAARTIGAFVNFGADYVKPGVVHYGGRGAVVVGEIDGSTTDRIKALHQLFLAFDHQAILTPNIWGYLWSKLAYGALLFATALTHESIADCLALDRFQSTMIALAREVVHIATEKGVRLEAFDGFEPGAFEPGRNVADGLSSLNDLIAFNRRSAKSHSGIWRDLSVRKRRTEVDAQLGAVVREAATLGLRAPITSRLVELIHEIEDGRRPQGFAALDELKKAAGG